MQHVVVQFLFFRYSVTRVLLHIHVQIKLTAKLSQRHHVECEGCVVEAYCYSNLVP